MLQTCRLLVVISDEHVVSDSGAVTSSSDTMTTAGIIVIAVVICIVVTSLVWFIVIYKSRRRRSPTPFRSDAMTACDAACHRTMSSVSDVDGSAQRLLACGSSHTDFLHTSVLLSLIIFSHFARPPNDSCSVCFLLLCVISELAKRPCQKYLRF